MKTCFLTYEPCFILIVLLCCFHVHLQIKMLLTLGSRLFGATYFVAVRFLHRSFRRQFGALWQFTYLGFGLGLWVCVSKKHRILAPKRAAPKSRGPLDLLVRVSSSFQPKIDLSRDFRVDHLSKKASPNASQTNGFVSRWSCMFRS